ncbi:hypothetical protein ZTR_11073, partial [Talaromyces verruculosus]
IPPSTGSVHDRGLPDIDPSSLMYVVFTSGSTGQPKGVQITHSAFSSALAHQTRKLGYGSKSRVSDFSSHAFDVWVHNNISPLSAGGCVLVPSEDERRRLSVESSCSNTMTHMLLTPSFARLLAPNAQQGLKLALIGESLTLSDVLLWWDHMHVMNTYGPAECTPLSMINDDASDAVTAIRIGRGAGVVTWVVEPDDHNRLAPIGAVGELLLEGPLLGQGYLNDPEKTAAAFIHDPTWLVQGTANHPGRHGRLYKTGDLVRYHDDGSLSFVGRKDTQVKIRGQRVELGEVEHHVRECFAAAGTVKQLAAEVITPRGDDARPLLAVFLQGTQDSGDDEKEQVDELGILSVPVGLEDDLASRLPRYMIPSVYFTVPRLPMTVTDKIDRRRLCEIGGSLSSQELADLRSQTVETKRMPSTDIESVLQQLWGEVLHLDPPSIGVDDSFFRLGGDSITAMRLVSVCRAKQLGLTATLIFQHPRLATLATAVTILPDVSVIDTIPPFALLKPDPLKDGLFDAVAEYGLDKSHVEDAYPCTPLQEGLLALSAKRPGDYVLRSTLQLAADIDVDRFRAAWNRTVELAPILRTRIVHDAVHGLLQIVLRDGIHWTESGDLEGYIKDDQDIPMGLGQPLTRFALIRDAATDSTWFVWTIHHALYDGTSMRLILDVVSRVYSQEPATVTSDYRYFIRYVCDQDTNATDSFWRTQFADCVLEFFPSIPPSVRTPMANARLTQSCTVPAIQTPDVTIATLIQAAWALVVHSYTAEADVVYGTTVSGRTAPVPGIEDMIGPTIATVPTRVRVSLHETVAVYLQTVQRQMADLTEYEHTGLQKIATVSTAVAEACHFQTLLVIQPAKDGDETDSIFGVWRSASRSYAFSSYALTLECFLDPSGIRVIADYDDRVLDQWSMERLLDHFMFSISELSRSKPEVPLKALSSITPADAITLWDWNHEVPAAVERCVHHLIDEQVRINPNAPAVHAWDGQLTYGELDGLATQLALHLIDVGVVPGTIVPLCFEKSMWTTVAVLGVLKAGAAFCMLEPSHPESRLQAIVRQTGATVVVSSSLHMGMSSRLATRVVVAGHGLIPPSNGSVSDRGLPDIDPSSLMYVVFTSGSTGQPKGASISHTAMSSNMRHQIPILGYTAQSRVFNSSNVVVDVFIQNIVATFICGGCLAVATETDLQNNMEQSIHSMEATDLDLTPSMARLLDPDHVRQVRKVILGGEPYNWEDIDRWPPSVHIINAYGPSECTPSSVINTDVRDRKMATRLGRAAGVVTWVVDPSDYNRLAPIGAVGELLLEGPLLGQGYLNDPEKTAAAFIHDPAWLVQGTDHHPGRHRRLYKTGDLVRYHDDGSLSFVGRKDTQVKIRGQRVELGEVEHHVRECLAAAGTVKQLAAEVVTPCGDDARPLLAVFVQAIQDSDDDGKVQDGELGILPIPAELEDDLASRLPSYMIPSVYFTLPQLPMTVTDKIDRRHLREIGGSLSSQELADLGGQTVEAKRMPSTDTERVLQQLWGEVLHLDPATIGVDDSFFRLGGDSIAAMRLVTVGREKELQFTVTLVFQNPRLATLAANVKMIQPVSTIDTLLPFSLLKYDPTLEDGLFDALAEIGLDRSRVEDAYPCTSLQEGLLALSAKRTGDYILRSTLQLADDIDVDRFRAAWNRTVELVPILRTRIVYNAIHGLVQIVIRDGIHWTEGGSLEDYIKHDQDIPMGLGQPLTRFALVRDAATETTWFVWTIHHALYDGISMRLMLDVVRRLYLQQSPKIASDYKHFIHYLCNQDINAAESFWRTQFANSKYVPFPSLPSFVRTPMVNARLTQSSTVPAIRTPDVTVATLIQAAWALVVHGYTAVPDVVYGTTVSGRTAPVAGIKDMIGPTIATVPTCIHMASQQAVSEYLGRIQRQMSNRILRRGMSLSDIAGDSAS